MPTLTQSLAFQTLERLAADLRAVNFEPLRRLPPALPPLRLFELAFDLSRQRVTAEILSTLLRLADERGFARARAALFAGEIVNASEQRPALHWQARQDPRADREDIAFAETVRSHRFRLPSGEPVRSVLHVGIGGSDVGPRLVTTALADDGSTGPGIHFLASLDPRKVANLTRALDPRGTLVVVASKGFGTEETRQNLAVLRGWLTEAAFQGAVVAATSNPARARDAGLAEELIFPFAEAVGGRFSLWTPVGLPIALAAGGEAYRQLLAGAKAADDHFRHAAPSQNIPLLRALYALFERLCLGAPALAVLAYDQRLSVFPEWRQQIIMESLGKGVTAEGEPLRLPGGPIVLGGTGTEVQHSILQALHQGNVIMPAEIIASTDAPEAYRDHGLRLLANAFAQADALWRGEDAVALRAQGCPERLIPHRLMPGLRPSTMILLPRLDPFHLGLLLALQEHQVFAEGVLQGLNSFDQWGVELGKRLAGPWYDVLQGAADTPGFPHAILGPQE